MAASILVLLFLHLLYGKRCICARAPEKNDYPRKYLALVITV